MSTWIFVYISTNDCTLKICIKFNLFQLFLYTVFYNSVPKFRTFHMCHQVIVNLTIHLTKYKPDGINIWWNTVRWRRQPWLNITRCCLSINIPRTTKHSTPNQLTCTQLVYCCGWATTLTYDIEITQLVSSENFDLGEHTIFVQFWCFSATAQFCHGMQVLCNFRASCAQLSAQTAVHLTKLEFQSVKYLTISFVVFVYFYSVTTKLVWISQNLLATFAQF